MPIKRRLAFAAGCVAALFAGGAARAAGLSGTFADDTIHLEIRPDNGGGGRYVGRIVKGDQAYPLTGHVNDDRTAVDGRFVVGRSSFPVVIEPERGGLSLSTGGRTYHLRPAGAPAAEGQPDARVPAGYALIRQTTMGFAMAARKADATTVRDALASAVRDLRRSVDPGLEVTGCYEDRRDHRSGMAAVSATLNGQRVKCFLAARLTDGGAVVAVACCRAGATAADWAALTQGRPAAPDGAAAIAAVRLRQYAFPDSTGSVGLAQGWRTDAASCQNGFTLVGPDGALIAFGSSAGITTPDSPQAQMQRQMAGMGGIQLPVAPLCDPVDAMVALVPQFSQMNQRQGLPPMAVDHVRGLARLPPPTPGSRVSLVAFGLTTPGPDGRPQHFQGIGQVMCTPVTATGWMYWTTLARSPDATFARDLPAMIAMINSWRTNDQVVAANTRAWVAASNAAFAAAHPELGGGGGAPDSGWSGRSTRTSRSLDDFDETIRGYTSVEDTTTGERA